MARLESMKRWLRMWACLFLLLGSVACTGHAQDREAAVMPKMILVQGGMFRMGNVFGDGGDNEQPVHEVTVSSFYLSAYEVTVGEFAKFVKVTGYTTSAEAPVDPDARRRIMEKLMAGGLKPEEMRALKNEMLQMGGTAYWDGEKCRWTGYEPEICWRNPGFAQTDAHPVVAVSAEDAMQYCNWLSAQAGLPAAYNPETCDLLNAQGKPTLDITQVRGIRLPTEAEWEYAARDRGKDVRFGNGSDTARSSEINFRATHGDYPYLERGEYRKGTTPVGIFVPNSLGLYDLSGNAWEWTGDRFAEYGAGALINPCAARGDGYALRGGRWGGDANEARVFHRSCWVRNDRCNNSGFRVAQSR